MPNNNKNYTGIKQLVQNAWVCCPSGYKDCWSGTELVKTHKWLTWSLLYSQLMEQLRPSPGFYSKTFGREINNAHSLLPREVGGVARHTS